MNSNGPFRRAVTRRRSWLCLAALSCMAFVLNACHAQDATDKPPARGQQVMLTMIAYNYTDHYINGYSVDGAGGGNVFLSDATSGGGGGACCVRWLVGRSLPVKVHIKWTSGECTYMDKIEGENFEEAKVFYTEKNVWLKAPVPAAPQYFETHFYPDGRVEVAITDDYSPPRLKLPVVNHKRPGAKHWPKCTLQQLHEGE